MVQNIVLHDDIYELVPPTYILAWSNYLSVEVPIASTVVYTYKK